MFFPDKIKSIRPTDKVLEVGPGAMPYHRSDVLLEKKFEETEWFSQSGNQKPEFAGKPVVFYDGGRFPFKDNEFDYVICSHVLEHVPNVEEFTSELKRIAKSGYIEFPTIYYDYIYNYDVHITLLLEKEGKILWIPKSETDINSFKKIQDFFKLILEIGNYDSTVHDLKHYFFQGFEWKEEFKTERVSDFNAVCYDIPINIKKIINQDKERVLKLEERIKSIEKSQSYKLATKLSRLYSFLKTK
jgi:SAM-dependent methyltransferase